MIARPLAVALLAALCASCVSSPQIDDLARPLQVGTMFEGLAYWVSTPVIGVAPYTFHWYGDTLRVWEPGTPVRSLHVSSCSGLSEALNRLKHSLGPAAESITSDIRPSGADSIILDGPTYRVEYSPPNIPGFVTLQSYDPRSVEWVALAEQARQSAAQCRLAANNSFKPNSLRYIKSVA